MYPNIPALSSLVIPNIVLDLTITLTLLGTSIVVLPNKVVDSIIISLVIAVDVRLKSSDAKILFKYPPSNFLLILIVSFLNTTPSSLSSFLLDLINRWIENYHLF